MIIFFLSETKIIVRKYCDISNYFLHNETMNNLNKKRIETKKKLLILKLNFKTDEMFLVDIEKYKFR